MHKIKFLSFLITGWLLTALPSRGQLVNEKFDRLDLSENFDTASDRWTFLSNIENLFLVQEGEYILNRKATEKPFALIANYDYNEQAFKIETSLKIEKSTDKNSSIGIIFMAQNDGNGGFIFEINADKEFRLRQIVSGSYKFMTGDAKNGGWTKSNSINGVNVYNQIDIRTSNRNYDIYINNNLLLSFTEIAYKTGRFGFIIGPATRAKIDYFYLFSAAQAGTVSKGEDGTTSSSGSPDIIELAESIIKLKTQINKLQAENEDLKRNLENKKTADKEDENERKLKDRTILDLQKKLAQKDASFDSLMKVNEGLLKYKNLVAGNENSDLIITLSKSVKAEKEKNQQLSDSLKTLKAELAKARNSKPTTVEEKKEPKEQKQNTEFTLPKEN